MADQREPWRASLGQLRVSELKDVLRRVGGRLSGNRPELLERIIQIHDEPHSSVAVESVIEDVRNAARAASYTPTSPSYSGGVYIPQVTSPPWTMQFQRQGTPGGGAGPAVGAQGAPGEPSFVHNPFIVNSQILLATIILERGANMGWNSGKRFDFGLTQAQSALLQTQNYRVFLRVGAIPAKVTGKPAVLQCTDIFPRNIAFGINGKPITEDLSKKTRPYDITNYLRGYPPGSFEMRSRVELSIPYGAAATASLSTHIIQVLMGQEETVENILAKMKHAQREKGIEMVQKKMAPSESEDVVVANSGCVKLTCPLGMVRMAHPCRGPLCNHLQCFDAAILLRMGQRTLRWRCPVCDKHIVPEDLLLDDYTSEVIAAAPDESMVEFLQDGSWRVYREEPADADSSEGEDDGPVATLVDEDTPPPSPLRLAAPQATGAVGVAPAAGAASTLSLPNIGGAEPVVPNNDSFSIRIRLDGFRLPSMASVPATAPAGAAVDATAAPAAAAGTTAAPAPAAPTTASSTTSSTSGGLGNGVAVGSLSNGIAPVLGTPSAAPSSREAAEISRLARMLMDNGPPRKVPRTQGTMDNPICLDSDDD